MTIQVFATDGFESVGEIVTFDRVEVNEKDLAVGAFQVVFDPANQPALAEAVMDATWLGVEVTDTETGWRFHGKVTQRRRQFQGGRYPRRIDLRGVDRMDDLAAVLQWPSTADYSLWWITSNGSQVLSTAVTNELYFERGAGALAERQLAGLTIVTPSPPFGPTKSWVTTGRQLLETWAPWFKNTAYTIRMRFNRSGAAGAAEIVFEVVERATTQVLVTPEFHHGRIEIVETAAAATHVIGMGELTGSIPNPDERYTAEARAAEANWLEGHRERFVNRPLSDQATLVTDVADELAASGPKLAAIADDIDVPDYGTSVLIGDYATVSFSPDEGAFLSPITAVDLVGTPAGWTRTASIGDAVPSDVNLLDTKIAALATQVRRVEGDLR